MSDIAEMDNNNQNSGREQPIEYHIDGTLDLHQFAPNETKEVVSEYIDECLHKGILTLRIIHGKGKGVQRRIVHSVLKDHADVLRYRHEPDSGGSWGATVVDLIADRGRVK